MLQRTMSLKREMMDYRPAAGGFCPVSRSGDGFDAAVRRRAG